VLKNSTLSDLTLLKISKPGAFVENLYSSISGGRHPESGKTVFF